MYSKLVDLFLILMYDNREIKLEVIYGIRAICRYG